MNFNEEEAVKENLNVIHGENDHLQYSIQKYSNFCAPNGYYNIDLIVDFVFFKSNNILLSEFMGFFPFKRLVFEMENDVHALFY